MRSCLLLLFIFFLSAPAIVFSQGEGGGKVEGDFTGLTMAQFFNKLEKQVPYKFYYDAVQLDSFIVQLIAKGETLPELLKEAFKGTDIHFSIDGNKNIFITRKLQIVTDLPKDFFGNGENLAGTIRTYPDSAADYNMESKKATKISAGKLIEIGKKSDQSRGSVILTGYVRDSKTGEPLVNASVFTDDFKESSITDPYGHYSLTLPVGNHILNVQVTGMKDSKLQVMVHSAGKLDVEMDEQIRVLKEVIVSGSKTSNIKGVQMGLERLSIESIRKVPTVFGEADVLRVVTSLPGVKTVGEASTGFNVRGGSADQNLILFNDATIYNPSHFFGMFSAFNPDVIKDIELYKSSIPAKYGGRLSSVLDITSREGNKKNITGSAGIGPVTSRFHLEGPIVKDKTSFIIGGRATYADWLLNLLPHEFKNSRAAFQDINMGISHRIDSSNNLYFNGYYSNDRFSLASDTLYSYSNRNINVKWKHNFTNKFNAIFMAGYDQYKYNVNSAKNKVNAFKLGFDINQLDFKSAFDYYLNAKHSFDFGISTIRYKLDPGFFNPLDKQSAVLPDKVETEQALESGIYFTHRYNPTSQLSFSTGLRYSIYNYLGPKQVSMYAPGAPITSSNVVEVKNYSKGKFIKTYQGPEIRFSVRYAFSSTFSIKTGYNSLRQYIHLLSNTTIIAPTDIWKLSDPNIKPQEGDQVSLGFYKNFKSNTIETSAEVYYKRIRDYLDYKPGATLFLNHNIETDVINTKAKAYGLEILIKKPGGKLNGWISYTYSRILLRAYDTTQGVIVNNGNYYPANYDKPNDVTLTGNFAVNHRFSLSLNSTYSTGRPITLPVGRYYYAGSQRVLYSDRNAYRIPDYFRTDFAMNIDGNYKVHQKTHISWTLGAYNLLGRKNPYSVYFVSENGLVNGYKLSIFGSVIPFINFNMHF
jgi:CarboxypepD_reg-like domain/TonB-dependent Receptor Plug Domain